jgi:hypothetical protein
VVQFAASVVGKQDRHSTSHAQNDNDGSCLAQLKCFLLDVIATSFPLILWRRYEVIQQFFGL